MSTPHRRTGDEPGGRISALLALLTLVVGLLAAWPSVRDLAAAWIDSEAYSHGVLDEGSLKMLRLTDYLFGTYSSADQSQPVDVLTTWHAHQTDGAANGCLPITGSSSVAGCSPTSSP